MASYFAIANIGRISADHLRFEPTINPPLAVAREVMSPNSWLASIRYRLQ